jgi:hypothetical protein
MFLMQNILDQLQKTKESLDKAQKLIRGELLSYLGGHLNILLKT